MIPIPTTLELCSLNRARSNSRHFTACASDPCKDRRHLCGHGSILLEQLFGQISFHTNIETAELEQWMEPEENCYIPWAFITLCAINTCKFMKEICVTVEILCWSSCDAWFPSHYPRNCGAWTQQGSSYGLFTAITSCKFMKDICVTMAIGAVMRPDPIWTWAGKYWHIVEW